MSKRKTTEIKCGPVVATWVGERRIKTGYTCSGEKAAATVYIFRIDVPEDGVLELGYCIWSNGERDVRILEASNVCRALRRLEHGLRQGVHANGRRDWVELSQARLKNEEWSNTFKANRAELDAGAGLGASRLLSKFGATAVGTKERILSDRGRKRGYLCAVFKKNSIEVPITAYLLTRVLPILNGYPA